MLIKLAAAIALCCIGLVVCAPMPPPRQARLSRVYSARTSHYEELYRSYLQPLNLFSEEPSNYAPVFSPRGRDPLSNPAVYHDLVISHPSYINPTSILDLTPILRRANSIIRSGSPPTQSEQRGFVQLFEEVGQQARQDLQIALHPENVAAQHREPLTNLVNKYRDLFKIIDRPENVDKLTNMLNEQDQERYMATHEILSAEKQLLGVAAKLYGARFPPL